MVVMTTNTKTWRIIDMIKWATSYLGERNFIRPRRDIEWLLQDVLQCSRVDLYLRFDEPLSRSQLDTLRMLVKRRITNEPVQYIIGKTDFYGLEFVINNSVLIPRPETERLVDVALHTLSTMAQPTILDIGTGSGCIAIALAHEIPEAQITAVDISDEILALAKTNAQNHSIENVSLIKMDFLHQASENRFDMIVCNPPYVPLAEMNSIMPDVRHFEPEISLTDGKDGLTFYRRLAEIGPTIVNHGGWMIMEVGLEDHPEKAKGIFSRHPFGDIELIPDYNGDPRVLKVKVTNND